MVFSDYNTKFLDENGTNHLIKELKEYMSGLATGDIDLSDYVTKSELQAKLDSLNINIDLSAYATKEELTTAINGIDLSAYATKDEIPSIDGLATTEYVDNAVANIPTGGEVDLSDYYNKEEVDEKITEIKPITTDEIKALFETEGLATKEDVSAAIDSIPPTDLTNYYNKEETYNKTEVDSLVANSSGSGSSGSSTGGSGITYAYDTEIATGDTWIDGKPIYLKVFHVDALESSSSTINYGYYHTQDKFAENIISFDTRWVRVNGQTHFGNVVETLSSVSTSSSSVGTSVNNNIISRMMWANVINGDTFQFCVARGSSMYAYACDISLRYTKI